MSALTAISHVKVVAIILSYRDALRTQRCVLSALDEGADGVVIWDNSDDGGESAGSIEVCDPRVELIVSPRNLGFGAGVNAALAYMQTRWPGAAALLLNNDATLRPRGLSDMLAHLRADTVVAPGINHAGEAVFLRYMHRCSGAQLVRPMTGAFAFPSGACLLLPPSLSVGPLFDEAFFMYGEDVDLGWRLLRSRHWHVKSTGTVLVDHEVAASSGRRTHFYETHVAASHWLLATRLATGPLDRVFLKLCRGIYLLARALVRSLREHSVMPWRGLWSGYRLAVVRDREHRRGL